MVVFFLSIKRILYVIKAMSKKSGAEKYGWVVNVHMSTAKSVLGFLLSFTIRCNNNSRKKHGGIRAKR